VSLHENVFSNFPNNLIDSLLFQAPVRAIQLQHQHRASVATAGAEQPHNHRLTHPSQQQQLTPGPGSVSTGQLSGSEVEEFFECRRLYLSYFEFL
jgi:hypothetical protein